MLKTVVIKVIENLVITDIDDIAEVAMMGVEGQFCAATSSEIRKQY